jgi:hypothetical protein
MIAFIDIPLRRFVRSNEITEAKGMFRKSQSPARLLSGPASRLTLRLGDGADRTIDSLQRSYLISFFVQQLRIARHGNTPKGLDQPSG